MRHVDYSPLFRSTVGFDRLFNMLDTLAQPEGNAPAYPPYNIERTGENAYRITMAVAGFSQDDLTIEAPLQRPDRCRRQAGEETDQEKREFFIAALPRAPSSAASSLPTMWRSRPPN